MLDWTTLGREKWNRAVEALLLLHYSAPGTAVRVYDGTGGDGGRDIEVVREDGHRIILQLKYFPEGFSSTSWGQRRKQIKKSFKAALKQRPDEWILVVPKNLTAGERTYIHGLAALAPEGDAPVIGEIAQTWLDCELAKHPELEDAFNRSEWERMAALLENVDRLPPSSPGAVVREVSKMQQRVDSVDPYWTWDTATVEGQIVRSLRAKVPNAHEASPVAVEVTVDPATLSAENQALIRSLFGFGLDGKVDLSPDAVARLEVKGPPLVAEVAEHVQVVFWRPPSNPSVKACRLELWRDGELVGDHVAEVLHFGGASGGHSLRMRLAGVLDIALLMPLRLEDACDMNLGYKLAPVTPPVAIAEALGFWLRLAEGHELRLFAEEQKVAVLAAGSIPANAEDVERMRATQQIADDLDVVGRALGRSFIVPDTYTLGDRAMLRAVRLMVEGKRTLFPVPMRPPIDLTAPGNEEFAATLLRGEEVVLYFEVPDYRPTLFGREIVLKNVKIGYERTVLADPEGMARMIAEMPGERVAGVLRPKGGHYFAALMPDFIDDPNRELPIVDWDVPEVREFEDAGRPEPAVTC